METKISYVVEKLVVRDDPNLCERLHWYARGKQCVHDCSVCRLRIVIGKQLGAEMASIRDKPARRSHGDVGSIPTCSTRLV